MTATAETEPPVSSRRRGTVMTMLTVIAIGVLLHGTIRDAWDWPTSVLFYLLPRPMLSAIAVLAMGLARRLTRREFLISFVTAAICLSWTLAGDVRWSRDSRPPGDQRRVRVVIWNAAHLPRGEAVAAEWIRKWDADVIGIVEAGTTYPGELERWRQLLPEYTIANPRSQSLILARGNIELGEPVSLGYHSDAMPARVMLDGATLDVLLVDICSKVDLTRSKPLAELVKVLESAPRHPHIIMGDFNTPPESVWLRALRKHYRSAFDVAGAGYRPTWPVPIPSLQLDYIWVNANITVSQCRHGWTTASDHRPVIADVTIATTATKSPDFTNRPPE